MGLASYERPPMRQSRSGSACGHEGMASSFPDIGRYYGTKGLSLSSWGNAPVVGWANLPSFKDHVEVVEDEDETVLTS